jgi:hypothetical protein
MRVREISQRTAGSGTTFLKRVRRNQKSRYDGTADQQHTHDERCGAQQFFGVPDPSGRLFGSVLGVSLHERHDGDAGLETGKPQRQFWEDQ